MIRPFQLRRLFFLFSSLMAAALSSSTSWSDANIIPGHFLGTARARVSKSQVFTWARKNGVEAELIRGSDRLWEIRGPSSFRGERHVLESPFLELVQDAWLETPRMDPPGSGLQSDWFVPNETLFQSMIFTGLEKGSTLYPSEMKPGSNWALERIHAPQAWIRRTSSDDVVVAVLDSGVDITHPDLKANLWVNPGEIAGNGIDDDQNGWVDDIHGYDSHYEKVEVQDEVGHGTYLAGIIGAVGNNGIGLSGVAWKTRLMVVRGDDHRRMSWTGAVKGAYYARDNGAKVINASWGTYSATIGLREMVRDMETSGVIVVNAVGNNSNNVDTQYRAYPAGYATSNLIVVTALHPNGGLVQYADYGEKYVHLAAPGWANPTTILGGSYGVQAGCSVAAPYVTGAVALVWAEHPEWTHQQVREQILSAVDRIPSLAGKVASGGVLNLARALGIQD